LELQDEERAVGERLRGDEEGGRNEPPTYTESEENGMVRAAVREDGDKWGLIFSGLLPMHMH
jgi:hypothetical protein